jgi:hypothetical protein
LAGTAALFYAKRREFAAVAVVGATLLTVALAAGGLLGRAARKETLGPLFAEADARGFGRLPVVNLHTIERSSEFYAAGHLTYDEAGEPRKLDGPVEVEDFARARGGEALVIVPLDGEMQLFNRPALDAEEVGNNGALALVYVRISRQ